MKGPEAHGRAGRWTRNRSAHGTGAAAVRVPDNRALQEDQDVSCTGRDAGRRNRGLEDVCEKKAHHIFMRNVGGSQACLVLGVAWVAGMREAGAFQPGSFATTSFPVGAR